MDFLTKQETLNSQRASRKAEQGERSDPRCVASSESIANTERRRTDGPIVKRVCP